MKLQHRLCYFFQQENINVPPEQARPVPPYEWTGYLKRLREHGDKLGFIDIHGRQLIISYEAFSGHYHCNLPCPEQQASYLACQNAHQIHYLIQSLPEYLIPSVLPELQLQLWYPCFEDSPSGQEIKTLLQQSNMGGQLARAAENICQNAVKGQWDKRCDDHLVLLQRILLDTPAIYSSTDFVRLQNGLQWLDEIVEHNDSFNENCMNDLCEMLFQRIIDHHNHQQIRH